MVCDSTPTTTANVRSAHWREIFAASIGNALEFYDLLIYGYFAIIIGQLFFPVHDATTSLLLSMGSFGVSFLMRPLGSVVLGSYADRVGRKASLTLSIGLMMLGTAMTVFVPTYQQIGIMSPIIIIIARMTQGFSSGGEFGAATAFMVEHADEKRRGFFASWQMSTLGLATVLAAGISALLSSCLSAVQISEWGWRVAFGVGLLIGPVGLYIRRYTDETTDFKQLGSEQKSKSPLREVFANDWHNMLLGGGVVAAATSFNYVHKLYMPTYAVAQLHLSATSSFVGALLTGLVLMVLAPLVGALADRYGYVKIMLAALVLIAVTTYPLFVLLNTWPTVTTFLLVQALVGLLIAASLGALPALLADIFPTHTRGTGLSISYNFSVTLFGGFAPLIVTWLIGVTHSKLAPSFYVMATAALSLVAIVALARRARATRELIIAP
ncbi:MULTISPECIES: MFS transporter [unclassified Herbaspirillum]|nr:MULTISPECIES: MFS transporter [unclassified Herbaspirillum]RFB71323.1 MFS transporter [Herbaspirillum sp. 3R-3a1]TFI09116.1 MFS transporter [Herbaspirillum sp. 3R11]TFI15534.1 MFS transporter [Herbaspirillum sp. 3R-11]TFI32052.1 MFS transporter [Herbaspirillum sp. 3C11]TFI32063.1 MFS transporter [Herbaspirillum sp. 3C11]